MEKEKEINENKYEDEFLLKGNKEEIKDYFFQKNVKNQKYRYKIFVRLYSKHIHFQNVDFQHSTFESCYLNNCTFDSCNFTGCRFVGCNLHQSSFPGCDFDYSIFERTQVDDDILYADAKLQENLRMRFARTLRMNYQQIGDAKAVNKAISIELNATSNYLFNSWHSKENYFVKKYRGFKKFQQFLLWLEFKFLDIVWGNGESILKLTRSILFIITLILLNEINNFQDEITLISVKNNIIMSFSLFFGGAPPKNYPVGLISTITFFRLVTFALFTTILVKRLGRR